MHDKLTYVNLTDNRISAVAPATFAGEGVYHTYILYSIREAIGEGVNRRQCTEWFPAIERVGFQTESS